MWWLVFVPQLPLLPCGGGAIHGKYTYFDAFTARHADASRV